MPSSSASHCPSRLSSQSVLGVNSGACSVVEARVRIVARGSRSRRPRCCWSACPAGRRPARCGCTRGGAGASRARPCAASVVGAQPQADHEHPIEIRAAPASASSRRRSPMPTADGASKSVIQSSSSGTTRLPSSSCAELVGLGRGTGRGRATAATAPARRATTTGSSLAARSRRTTKRSGSTSACGGRAQRALPWLSPADSTTHATETSTSCLATPGESRWQKFAGTVVATSSSARAAPTAASSASRRRRLRDVAVGEPDGRARTPRAPVASRGDSAVSATIVEDDVLGARLRRLRPRCWPARTAHDPGRPPRAVAGDERRARRRAPGPRRRPACQIEVQ